MELLTHTLAQAKDMIMNQAKCIIWEWFINFLTKVN